jgi:hypothetical protein
MEPARQWKKIAGNEVANTYTFNVLPDTEVQVGDTLRVIARDIFESVGVVDYVVTSIDDDIVIDIDITRHYRDLTSFPFYVSEVNTGAMVMKQMLDYLMWNSTLYPEGPQSQYSEQTLYNTYKGADAFIDVGELCGGLNAEIDDHAHGWIYGYFFNPSHNVSATVVMKRACIWLDYNVDYYNDIREPDVPKQGHPNHVPVAVPTGGDYDNWMVIRGIHTDRNTWPPGPEFVVNGFWINDPSTGGIGDNWYMTAQYFDDNYFDPMTVGPNAGEYVVITDPPNFDIDEDFSNVELEYGTPVAASQKDARIIRSALRTGLSGAANVKIMGIAEIALEGVYPDAITSPTQVQKLGSEYVVTFDNGIQVFLDASITFVKLKL